MKPVRSAKTAAFLQGTKDDVTALPHTEEMEQLCCDVGHMLPHSLL